MRLRLLAVSVLAATAATLPLAGVASAQPGDRDCDDFSSQAEAQEALESSLGDPERLDANDNGEACENHDYGSAAPTTTPTPTTAPTTTTEPAADEEAVATSTSPADTTTDEDSDDTGQVSVVPRGGVDTGDGSSNGAPGPLLLGGVLALGVAGAALRQRAHGAR